MFVYKLSGCGFESRCCLYRPCLANQQKNYYEIKFGGGGGRGLCNAFKSMNNNKTLGNGGLSKEFYEAFWIELKDHLLKLFYHAKTYKEFSVSQR